MLQLRLEVLDLLLHAAGQRHAAVGPRLQQLPLALHLPVGERLELCAHHPHHACVFFTLRFQLIQLLDHVSADELHLADLLILEHARDRVRNIFER